MTRRGLLSWIHTAMCRACVGGHVRVVTALLDSPLIIDEEEQCKGEEAAQVGASAGHNCVALRHTAERYGPL